MQKVFQAVRSKVSADKNRYQLGGYDLDLTYITERIIAMAFPSEGYEKVYRNNIDDVSRLLNEKHKGHFYVYNLSDRAYDYEKFDNNVHSWCGWPDHFAPSIALLFKICSSIYRWLREDPQNVVILHCLAGKGRTGTAIAAFLLYSGLFSSAEKALRYFACKRSITMWGVTNPCQVRYVQYIEQVYVKGRLPSPKAMLLREVVMHTIPNFDKGCSPYIEVFSVSNNMLIAAKKGPLFYSVDGPQVVSLPVNKVVSMEICLIFRHQTPIYRTDPIVTMFRVQFHVGMLSLVPRGQHQVAVFTRAELDDAYLDKRFSKEFRIELILEELQDEFACAHIPEPEVQEELAMYKLRPDEGPVDGSICFFPGYESVGDGELDKMESARRHAMNGPGMALEKSGYLFKQGHRVKNWKRRWFVLKGNTVCYFKSPRSIKPNGAINVNDIWAVLERRDEVGEEVVFSYRLKSSHSAPVEALVSVGSQVWSGTADGNIVVWDTTTGHMIKVIDAHEGAVTALIATSDVCLSAGTDGVIIVWSRNYEKVATLKGHSSNTSICLLSVDGWEEGKSMAISGDTNGAIMMWNLKRLKLECSMQLDMPVTHLCRWRNQVWAALDTHIYVFDLWDWQTRGTIWKAHEKKINGLVAINRKVWSVSDDKTVCVWSSKAKSKLHALRRHKSGVTAIAIIGDHIWTSGDDNTVILWDVTTQKCIFVQKGKHLGTINNIVDVGQGIVWTASIGDRNLSVWTYVKEIQNGFELITSTDHYLVQADTREEKEDWIEILELGRLHVANTESTESCSTSFANSFRPLYPSNLDFLEWQKVKLVVKDLWIRGSMAEGTLTCQLTIDNQVPITFSQDVSFYDTPIHWEDILEFFGLSAEGTLVIKVWHFCHDSAKTQSIGQTQIMLKHIAQAQHGVNKWIPLSIPRLDVSSGIEVHISAQLLALEEEDQDVCVERSNEAFPIGFRENTEEPVPSEQTSASYSNISAKNEKGDAEGESQLGLWVATSLSALGLSPKIQRTQVASQRVQTTLRDRTLSKSANLARVKTVRSNAPPYKDTPQVKAKAAKPFALEDIVPQMLCDGNLGERQESLCLSSSEEVLVPDQKPKNM